MSTVLVLKSMFLASNLLRNVKENKKLESKNNKKKPISKQSKFCTKCRVCYKREGEIQIFDNVDQPHIAQEIEHFSGIKMDCADNLPKTICLKCLNLLNGCIKFREMCQDTNKLLLEVIEKKDTVEKFEIDDFSYEVNIEPTNDLDGLFDDPPTPEASTQIDVDKPHEKYKDKKCDKSKLKNAKQSTNTEEKETYLCDICGKALARKQSLEFHMTTHSNVFPFKCDSCPYKGRTANLLRTHKRTHMTEKPYKCSLCPKTTTSASNLLRHKRYMHSNDRPYKCTMCVRAFAIEGDLNRHMRKNHLGIAVVCNLCSKEFSSRKVLRNHKLKVHQVKVRYTKLPSYIQCKINGELTPQLSEEIHIKTN